MSKKLKSGILSLVVVFILLINIWFNFTKAVDENNHILNINISSTNDIVPAANLSLPPQIESSSSNILNSLATTSSNTTNTREMILNTTLPGTNKDSLSSATDSSSPSHDKSNEVTFVGSNVDGKSNSHLCSNNTASRNSTSDKNKFFDMTFAIKAFENSMINPNIVPLHDYLLGFKEFMKFFNNLGTIFYFVSSDLDAKINLLETYRRLDTGECNNNYNSIQSSIEYETKEDLLKDTKRPSASRTILRLHRALQFLSALMSSLSKLEDDAETSVATKEAYGATLANHHPWAVRTIASFAVRSLPAKKQLIDNVIGAKNYDNLVTVNEQLMKLSNVTGSLFEIVDKYYTENNLQDLP